MAIKKIITVIVLCMMISCSNNVMSNGKVCNSYGLFNKNEKCENVKYKPDGLSIILGILLFPSIITPIWMFGYELYEPVKGE